MSANDIKGLYAEVNNDLKKEMSWDNEPDKVLLTYFYNYYKNNGKTMMNMYLSLDRNGNGYISISELKRGFEVAGIEISEIRSQKIMVNFSGPTSKLSKLDFFRLMEKVKN
mmetsp:Transcript_16104/g.22924  ORF Transcript_16104/g.22924 Transcript_16104/m.22924 type:complete len:111 (+) Transcript_16104:96-428(+)|eukprot:CAMPEP_0184872344 /NCGR_PEP_ID=MMETSP0580-20130426/41237_1 /TAXON_ID=1118495 /ORGANISM="Dactyliosolen fragilissimus" /LENGTH=110 /DNA_ID=CAMNT_0027375131 /DNA_START=482 /DNA_END=814 /DNA_ORIENTATION=+